MTREIRATREQWDGMGWNGFRAMVMMAWLSAFAFGARGIDSAHTLHCGVGGTGL